VPHDAADPASASQLFPIPVAGVRVGHWTGDGTGVTVVLAPQGTVGSGEVRGGAPASRELALLDPTRSVTRVDAITLAGGSAFGLAAADGVMRYLAEHGNGFPTAGGPVPIVPTACVFDLVESVGTKPGPEQGYAAAASAGSATPIGRVGAGRGATVGKWRGRDHAVPGGFGAAADRCDDATVIAFAVVNAVGDVVAADGTVLAGSTAPAGAPGFPTEAPFEERAAEARTNTTLVVVVTDAVCDKVGCSLVAQSAHDGFARALRPAHTRHDGDVAFALATGAVDANLDRIRVVAADVVAEAIRGACR
jgi:L-aminopeptidase/D-esterase-like protein